MQEITLQNEINIDYVMYVKIKNIAINTYSFINIISFEYFYLISLKMNYFRVDKSLILIKIIKMLIIFLK